MHRSFYRSALFVLLLSFISLQASAQDDLDELMQGSAADAEKLVGAYLSPIMKSLSLGLNQGWYNTAKPHKTAGVDLTFTINAMRVPDSELFYNVANLNLQYVSLDPTSPDYRSEQQQLAPTVMGPGREPIFRIEQDGESQLIEGPGGVDFEKNVGANVVPVPMVQFGFGLPKGTDIKLRFIPKLKIGDETRFNLFGIGVMHDIKQWIPGIKTMPFDLSAFAGFTRTTLAVAFPDDDFRDNAKGEMYINSATVQGIISKKISVLTLYGAAGYNIAKSRIAMLGSYDINEDGDFADVREKNPLDLKHGASGPRMTAGFRLKLAVITLHVDYTLQKYSCLSAGFGISVR